MKKAILVIDMQEIFVGENHAAIFKYDIEELIMQVNHVIDNNNDNLVIYVRNLMKKSFINRFAPFQVYEGTRDAQLAAALHIVSDHIFDKYTGDAFSNLELNTFLKQQKVEVLEVIGVDGGGCVALTGIGACKAGYNVIINTKAIGTVMKAKQKKYNKLLAELGATFV